MPPGFGVLDAALVAVPIFLMLLGLIRGAPVELASCLGCVAGVIVAWLVSSIPLVHGLGQPMAPLLAVVSGIIAWRFMRGLSHRLGFDTRWINLGRLFDSFVGGLMGAVRGVALVAVACLSYQMIAVPFGLGDPMRTVAYPVYLAIGSQVTSIAVATADPMLAKLVDTGSTQSMATVPLPFTAPRLAALPPQVAIPVAATLPSTNGIGLQTLIYAIAPSAAAAPVQPLAVYHPEIAARGIPVSLLETHHNLAHPFGFTHRRH